jgi:hypothetical protein
MRSLEVFSSSIACVAVHAQLLGERLFARLGMRLLPLVGLFVHKFLSKACFCELCVVLLAHGGYTHCLYTSVTALISVKRRVKRDLVWRIRSLPDTPKIAAQASLNCAPRWSACAACFKRKRLQKRRPALALRRETGLSRPCAYPNPGRMDGRGGERLICCLPGRRRASIWRPALGILLAYALGRERVEKVRPLQVQCFVSKL